MKRRLPANSIAPLPPPDRDYPRDGDPLAAVLLSWLVAAFLLALSAAVLWQ